MYVLPLSQMTLVPLVDYARGYSLPTAHILTHLPRVIQSREATP